MKKRILLILLISISISSFGQKMETQAIDSIFSEWNKINLPGCALGIIQEGELIYSKGYGLANMEYDIPNSDSSVFRIGSTSKQFTAACIVLLSKQGKLSLNDNLKSIFSDFPDYAEKITIKHLLNHTSGIRDYLQIAFLKGLGDDDYYEDADVMKWLTNQANLNFAPGDEFLYSNSGYWLLGQIVNKVSGMNMADFAKKEIFDPLKMNNTHFHNDHTQIVRDRASGYIPGTNNDFKISMTTLNMIGDGGIFTTIKDIKKWDDAYYNSTVFDEAFWNVMTQQGLLNNEKVIDYACGLMTGKYKGLKTIRHGGAYVGFRAELLRFPEEQLTIAIFANRGDANPAEKANQVADLLLKEKLMKSTHKKEEINSVTTEEEFHPKQLVGDYEIQPGVIMNFSLINDSLKLTQTWNQESYNIIKANYNTYKISEDDDISLSFSDLKDGLSQTLTILKEGREIAIKRKKEIDSSGVHLEEYVGSYYCKELDVTYNIEIENGILTAKIKDKHSLMDCTISDIDQFTMQLGLIRFQRTNGIISGFELDSGRVKNLQFEKK